MRTLSYLRPSLAVLALFSLVWAACSDSGAPSGVDVTPRLPVVASGVTTGIAVPAFLWLDPLVEGTPPGPLALGLEPVVRITDLVDNAEVILAAAERDGHYAANWNTEKEWTDRDFRIEVFLESGDEEPVASLVVTLQKGGSENAGRTIPVKFWMGLSLPEVADCLGDDRCNATNVPGPLDPDSESPTIIETRTEGGLLMAVLTLPAGSAPVPLNVILDCRYDDYEPGEGPLPTALAQWPLFCHVDARELDGTQFAGSLINPATIEICVVDDEVDELQAEYHSALDHTDLLLGKSSNGSDFEYLPFAPTPSLNGCAGLTIDPVPPSEIGLLERLKAPIDGLLHWVGPRPLNATMFRRDGGVGGTLSAFSDINPVEPAYIEGFVFGGAGATITATGGGFSASATVGGDGSYRLGPLPVPVLGVTYAVEVGGEAENVPLSGSGTTAVDFVLEGSSVIAGFGGSYDWSIPDVGSGTGDGPFLSTTGYPHGVCTLLDAQEANGDGTQVWPVNSTVTLIREVDVPLGTDYLEILGWVDNDAMVYVTNDAGVETNITAFGTGGAMNNDGFRWHENCANDNPLTFLAGTGTFTPGKTNTLRFVVKDRGAIAYADFQVTAVNSPPIP